MIPEAIFITRYIIIPFIGLLVGGFIFIIIYRNYEKDYFKRFKYFVGKNIEKIIFCEVLLFSAYFFAIIILRYSNNNLGVFDFGIYDWRIWKIHAIPWSQWIEKIKSSLQGHFQPILVIYSFLYDLGIDPLYLNILQATAVLSATIPLYLLVKSKISSQLFIFLILSYFFLYPALQFNMAIDFHPDHLIIPIFFWFYYFAEKGKYLCTIPLFFIGFTLKEPLIIAFAFSGVYIAWEKKHYLFGVVAFLLSLVIFYVATFLIIPKFANLPHHETIIGSGAFSYLFDQGTFKTALKEIMKFEKWRFPFYLLFPFLFLPLLKFKIFLPAFPLLGIPVLSTVIHHQNVASQYTAGIIAPLFISFTWVIAEVNKKYGERLSVSILAWIGILLIAFNIAHSPSPLAIAFWNKDWSHGKWHFSNYLKKHRYESIKKAINQIPSDPNVKVVTHSMVYDRRLAHRFFYKPFPMEWPKADYIILDDGRGGYVSDTLNEAAYWSELEKLKRDSNFEIIYENQGIRLFRKIK